MFRTTTTVLSGWGRRHIHVSRNHKREHWCLQWAHPTQLGYHYDQPFEEGFNTKALALARRREIYDPPAGMNQVGDLRVGDLVRIKTFAGNPSKDVVRVLRFREDGFVDIRHADTDARGCYRAEDLCPVPADSPA